MKQIMTAVGVLVVLAMAFPAASGFAAVAVDAQCASVAAQATGDEPGGDEGCAAAYLVDDNPAQMQTLRLFRDRVLSGSAMGEQLISMFYARSDSLITLFQESPAMEAVARRVLSAVLPVMQGLAGR